MAAKLGPVPSPPEPDGTDYEATIEALSECAEDALSEAACGGLLDPNRVTDWAARVVRLVLYERERSALRSVVPSLAKSLDALIREVDLPAGLDREGIVRRFIDRLPTIRSLLADDVEVAYQGDPAARNFQEVVVAYPSIQAIATYRIAHELHGLGVPLLPRIMTEYAHSRTGIDIHPGATIGRRFFIDHGTGVVIGETAEVGNGVRLYQGVTIGATSVRGGQQLRGVKRHPTIEDDVTIYAGATVLGGDTCVGRGSVIGGNVWLTQSVPSGSRVVAEPARTLVEARSPDASDESSESDHLQLQWDI